MQPRALFLFCISLMWSASTLAYSGQVSFQRLFTEHSSYDQSALGAITVINEDPQGFIWFGGEQGLGRYDGHSLHVYRKEDGNERSLPRNFIRDIVFDHHQVMWVATGSGLVSYNPETDDFTRFELNRDPDSASLSRDISSLAVDRLNNLIVGTHIGLAIVDESRQKIRKYHHNPSNPASLSDDYVKKVYVDSRNQLWVGTAKGGLNLFSAQHQSFRSFQHVKGEANSLVDNDVRAITQDHKGRLWIGTYGGGVSRLNEDLQSFKNYRYDPNKSNSIGAVSVIDIIEDNHQNLWFATDHGGLARYQAETDGFEHFRHSDYDINSISSNHVRTLFEDRRGDLWVGTFPIGVNFFDRSTSSFSNYTHRPDEPRSLSDSGILTFFQDRDKWLWIGTENGLNIFNREAGTFKRIYDNPDDPKALQYRTVLDIEEDVDGSLWMGTWSGGLHRYDKKTGIFKHYNHDPNDPNSLNSQFVWRILKDSNNHIWVGTEKGGLNRYVPETDSFIRYDYDPSKPGGLVNDHIWVLFEDSRKNFWIGSFGGLQQLDRKNNEFINFLPEPNNPNSMRGTRVSAIVEDRLGRIWIATQDEGINIYSPSENHFSHINMANGLPTNEVASLQQDNLGNIWASTTAGIVRIDLGTLSTRLYTKDHGLVGNNFNRDASFLDDEGYLYFGGTEGFSVFHPAKLAASLQVSPTHITQLNILNRGEKAGANYGSYSQNLLGVDEIELAHSDSVFTIDYSVLSYRSPERNRYAYKLEGFDQHWHFVGNRHTATYTNLDAGEYVFEVKGANRDGVWNVEPARLRIRVHSPPWLSWWAYCCYFSLAVLLLWLAWRQQANRLEFKREKRLNAQLLKVDQLKDAILANTSHELRAPLNNIMGLAECVVDGAAGEVSTVAKDYVQRIADNSRKLANFIDNVLDYSNLAGNESALVKKPIDIYSIVQTCIASQASSADEKGLLLNNNIDKGIPLLFGDEAGLQQVFNQLLQNAIKYTHSGSVNIDAAELHDRIKITVSDTGEGISQQEQQSLFDPFYIGGGSQVKSGVGLGLALTKHLVDLHGGHVSLESELGQGSKFIIELPKAEHERLPAKTKHPREVLIDFDDQTPPENSVESAFEGVLKRATGKTVVVADGDRVNRIMMLSMLTHYGVNTFEASTGEEVLNYLEDGGVADLIVLEAFLPDRNGIDLCRSIREKFSAQRLPVVFLTARKIEKIAMEVYCAGGNDLLFKPVSKYELLPRLAQLFDMADCFKSRSE